MLNESRFHGNHLLNFTFIPFVYKVVIKSGDSTMRTNTIFTLCVTTFCALFFLASPSFALLSDVVYFDFSGWDNSLVTSPGGQTFNNIFGDVDVTVEASGALSVPTKFTAQSIKSGLLEPGTNTFQFTFSEPLRLVVRTYTVDSQERAGIFTTSSESYFHNAGANPTVTSFMSGIRLVGNGTGISPTGAADGETLTGVTSLLTVTHQGFRTNKYEQISVGTLVPEPNSVSLFGIGLLGLVMRFRKRNQ
jgi:hypothetical protein